MKLELLAEGYAFLEAPRVDSSNNLYFSDIVIGGIFKRSPDGKVTHFISDRPWIGGIALNQDGRVVVSGHGGLLLYDPARDQREILLERMGDEPVKAINDIQPDGLGGLYAGLIDPAAQMLGQAQAQPLVLLSAERRARRVAEGIKVSNGIALSPDGRILYQAETMDGVIAYDRASDGALSPGKLAIKHSYTDGIAVDSLGFIWLAAPNGSAIFRYAPDGHLDRQIDIPVKEVASLTFGGADLRDLYIVTGSAINMPDYKRTGNIYRMRSDIAGQETPLTRF